MKKAILTGANGNLGRDFINTLIANNYAIYAVDKNIDQLNFEDNITPIKLDITNENEVKNFYQKIDKLDLIVNNAGIGVFSSFEERTAEEFRLVTDVNLLGTFLMAQGAIKIMKSQNHGKIVNIASIYGVKSSDYRIYGSSGRNNSEVYSATKAGIIQLTKYMATHFGKYNIQTNSISPGGIYNGQSEDFVENYKNKTPLGRMGKTADICNALNFLCSEKTDYINGQNIVVDGGFLAW
jgi:3-oxoacyl-[acyl-carrier protein] reductase